jgi:hypothetical protein
MKTTQTLTADQIGHSHGAYSGKQVTFSLLGQEIAGTLTRSDWEVTGVNAFLWVDGALYTVPADTKVEVA